MAFETVDLGNVLNNAAITKQNQQKAISGEQADQLYQAHQFYTAALQNPNIARTEGPRLQKAGILDPNVDFSSMSPEQVASGAQEGLKITKAMFSAHSQAKSGAHTPADVLSAQAYETGSDSYRNSFQATKGGQLQTIQRLNDDGSMSTIIVPKANMAGLNDRRPNQINTQPQGSTPQGQPSIQKNQPLNPVAIPSKPSYDAQIDLAGRKEGAKQSAQLDYVAPKEKAKIEADLQTKNIENAKIVLPQKIMDLEYSIQQVDQLIAHPGKKAALGPIDSRTPTFLPETADFEARLETMKSTVFVNVREILKGAGPITDFEGRKAESAYLRADKAQTVEQFDAAMNEYKYWATRGLQKIQQQAGSSETVNLPTAPAGMDKVKKQLYGTQSQAVTPKLKRGHVEDGHTFIGDDPADPKSWKKNK